MQHHAIISWLPKLNGSQNILVRYNNLSKLSGVSTIRSKIANAPAAATGDRPTKRHYRSIWMTK